MKVLLTGPPGSGKTTLLNNFLITVKDKQGFITREILKEDQRIGFEMISSTGHTAELASISSQSRARISKYGVDVEQLNRFIKAQPKPDSNKLLYIDEIGAMQLFSSDFKGFVRNYIDQANNFIGTIKDFDDEFANEIRSREDIKLIRVGLKNRDELARTLPKLFKRV